MSIRTDFTELSDEQVRAVRNDRMAIGDDLFAIIDTTLDGVTIRAQIYTHMAKLTADAMQESLDRLTPEGTGQ